MTLLTHLSLSAAGFSGRLPTQLGNLTNLIRLDLNVPIECYNKPHALYSENLRWASNLSKLQSLDLSNCNLSEARDTFRVLAMLPSLSTLRLSGCGLRNIHLPTTVSTSSTFFSTLKQFDLSFNSFKGPLPSFFKNAVSLQHLDLTANYFEGPFPFVLKNTVSLRYLSLRDNNFNGSIPSWLKNMRCLRVLDLGVNEFSYVEGGMWGIMGNSCKFKYLDLSGNSIVQGDLLNPFVNSSVCVAYDLEYLDLGYNKLYGSLPSILGRLENLKHLDLSNNGFQGRIPASVANLSKLKYLNLGVNRLDGLIPDVFREIK
ncbi:hypothetical protein RND81_14G117000 [Saponaria officinalis]|uniref:Uncharacterized protein n=1 Tax=Saponaria officinalis TaxID=3572 RepID=A0AAW1GPD6_SAPOF